MSTGADGRIWIHRFAPTGDTTWTGSVRHSAARPTTVAVANLSSGGVVLAYDDGSNAASRLVFTDTDGVALMQRASAVDEPVTGLQVGDGFVVGYGMSSVATAYDDSGDLAWHEELGMQVLTTWSTDGRVVTVGWVGGATCSFEHTGSTPDVIGKELPDYDPVAATADGEILSLDGTLLRGGLTWGHSWSYARPDMTPAAIEGSRTSNGAFVILESENGDTRLDFIQLPG